MKRPDVVQWDGHTARCVVHVWVLPKFLVTKVFCLCVCVYVLPAFEMCYTEALA